MTTTITLRFSGDADSYGHDVSRADMDAMNELMAEYLESLGYDVEIGPDTDSNTSQHSWDVYEADSDDALRELTNAAWEHACGTYEPASVLIEANS